jgi:hypothetical protein
MIVKRITLVIRGCFRQCIVIHRTLTENLPACLPYQVPTLPSNTLPRYKYLTYLTVPLVVERGLDLTCTVYFPTYRTYLPTYLPTYLTE